MLKARTRVPVFVNRRHLANQAHLTKVPYTAATATIIFVLQYPRRQGRREK